MKNKIIPIILLTSISASVLAVSIYKDSETTLDIYRRLEYPFANGDASFAGHDSRNQLGGRLGIYATRDISLFEETKVIGGYGFLDEGGQDVYEKEG